MEKYYREKQNVKELRSILRDAAVTVQKLPKRYFPELEFGLEK